ncbi:MAG: prephenate/arogenate dehydrogenase family protein [Alphaproteobacteria bacterium]|jgi:cyclohexadieny/prephenate dehydrogenase|nr:prephenate/arogenate dehydrogenase family protein [Alphaproteobacteria bacterium]
MTETAAPLFQRVALIGIGLIASSLAHAMRARGLAAEVVATSRSAETRARAAELGIVDAMIDDPAECVRGADLVVLAVPVRASGAAAASIVPGLSAGAIVTDVGSVKGSVIEAVVPHLPEGVSFVPGHPIAGTEHSGPDAGFAELFEGRWCVLTPTPETDAAAVERVAALWRAVGSRVDTMDPEHHDIVLAITSHIPHLIAYNIVATVTDLEDRTKKEAIKYAAGGFRDFTRIAASDPVMWRDVFLANREAVLEMLGTFNEDLARLQRAIRRGEGDFLEELFTETRAIRRGVIEAEQA